MRQGMENKTAAAAGWRGALGLLGAQQFPSSSRVPRGACCVQVQGPWKPGLAMEGFPHQTGKREGGIKFPSPLRAWRAHAVLP